MAITAGNRTVIFRRAKRTAPFAMALVFHGLLIAVLLSKRTPPPGAVARVTEVSLVEGTAPRFSTTLAAEQAEAAPEPTPNIRVGPSTAAPDKVVPPPEHDPTPLVQALGQSEPSMKTIAQGGFSLTTEPIALTAPPPASAPATLQTAGSKGCQIAAAVQASVQTHDDAKAALAHIPIGSRSVANAILLWNGEWIDPSSVGGTQAFGDIGRMVVDTVSQAPPNCQTEVIHGVRFVILPDARNTIVLGFGSNTWRWADVAATFSTKFLN